MWNLPPADTVLHLLSWIALAAQAMTAALAAGRRSMDWAGVCMLGCITALGGGTIRDVLLGHYPLLWVQYPSYLALTAVAAFLAIPIARTVHRLSVAFLVLDAIGLVVFTMAGCDVAWQMDASLPIVIVMQLRKRLTGRHKAKSRAVIRPRNCDLRTATRGRQICDAPVAVTNVNCHDYCAIGVGTRRE